MAVSEYIQRVRRHIGNGLLLLPGVSGIVINPAGQVLLHKVETGRWQTLGGAVDPGEEPADAVVREVWEEAGVRVMPERIVSVSASPRMRYPNGDEVIYITTAFACRPVGGEPRANDDESLEVRYFEPDELPDLRPDQRQRVLEALAGRERAQFRWNGSDRT